MFTKPQRKIIMKLSIYFGALLLMIAGLSINSYGQEPLKSQGKEMQRQKLEQRNVYRQTLQIDSLKADQIWEAQNTYKETLKTVMADTTLNDGAKRSRIKLLMEVKNEKLRKLLNDSQQRKLIPTTERAPVRDSKTNR